MRLAKELYIKDKPIFIFASFFPEGRKITKFACNCQWEIDLFKLLFRLD